MLGLGLGLWNNVAAQSGGGGGGSTTTWDTVNSNAGYTYTNSNKTATLSSGSGDERVIATKGRTSGDYTVVPTAPGTVIVGMGANTDPNTFFVGGGDSCGYASSGNIYVSGSAVQTGLATYTTSDPIKCALSGTTVTFYKNGVQVGSPVNMSGLFTTGYPMCSSATTGAVFAADFTNWP